MDDTNGPNIIFDTGDAGGAGITLLGADDELRIVLSDGAGNTTDTTVNQSVFSSGTWHHVAVTIDRLAGNDQIKAYVDGNLVFDQSFSLPNWAPGQFGLGTINGTSVGGISGNLDGEISHFRVHDQALNQTTIVQNASSALNTGLPAVVTGIDTTSTNGTVTFAADGSFTYDPAGAYEQLAPGQTGTDSFTYTCLLYTSPSPRD